jgi:Fe-S-cluster containining protein
MPTKTALPLVLTNAETATFECIYGRGCDGKCCQNGRPGLHPEEKKRIAANLNKFLPHLRPKARKIVEKHGIVTKRTRFGLPLVPVEGGWCVFFNEGCVLHKVGAMEGDAYKYKPIQCALFPLLEDDDGTWYVRQWEHKKEPWDIFCLNPKESSVKAVDSLQAEMKLAVAWSRKKKKRKT